MTQEKGMAFAEIILALALAGVIGSGLLSVYWCCSAAFERQNNQAEVQYSARQGRQSIAKDFYSSSSFFLKNTNLGHEIEARETGHCLHLVQENQTIEYYVYGQQLYRNPSAAFPGPVAECIAELTFVQSSPTTIEISILAASGDQKYCLDSRCSLRIR